MNKTSVLSVNQPKFVLTLAIIAGLTLTSHVVSLAETTRSSTTESTISAMSKAVASKVYNEMNEEGMQAKTARVAVVCAVPLSDLKRETEFGRIVSEYFSTDLADRGVLVQELRLGKDIQILPQSGEFILSQNPGELANEALPIDYVVVSTFSNTKKTLILQGRMVSMQSGLIMTSWRYTMPLRDDLMSLLGASEPAFTIAVKGK